jgi:hypothetical protein
MCSAQGGGGTFIFQLCNSSKFYSSSLPDDSSMLGAAKLITNVRHTAAAAALLYHYWRNFFQLLLCYYIQQRVCIIDEIAMTVIKSMVENVAYTRMQHTQKKMCKRQVLNYISRLQIGKLLYNNNFSCANWPMTSVYIIMYRVHLPKKKSRTYIVISTHVLLC